MVVQYILMRLIMGLCKETVRLPGMWMEKRWCKQEGLDLAGSREAAEAAEK